MILEEVEYSRLERAVANREHMIAPFNVERDSVGHQRGELLCGPGNIVLRPNANKRRLRDTFDLFLADEFARGCDAGCERLAIAFGLICKAAEHLAAGVGH